MATELAFRAQVKGRHVPRPRTRPPVPGSPRARFAPQGPSVPTYLCSTPPWLTKLTALAGRNISASPLIARFGASAGLGETFLVWRPDPQAGSGMPPGFLGPQRGSELPAQVDGGNSSLSKGGGSLMTRPPLPSDSLLDAPQDLFGSSTPSAFRACWTLRMNRAWPMRYVRSMKGSQ